jgi:threonine aldolase
MSFLAAAGLVALDQMMDRLVDDIRRAKRLAGALDKINGINVKADAVESNIVMADISGLQTSSEVFLKILEQQGVKASQVTNAAIRFTFHRHIQDEDLDVCVSAIQKVIDDFS